MTDTPITDAQVEAVARRYCVLIYPWATKQYVDAVWAMHKVEARQHIAMARAVREVMGGDG